MPLSRLRMATLLLLVSGLLTAAPLSAQPSGELVGCITDVTNQKIPGATVIVRASGFQQTLLADADGCYAVKSLPQNRYMVTAVLLGFDNETRENVRVDPASVARVDFQMRVSGFCECLTITGLLKHWESASSVVHLRITDHETALSSPPGSFRHTAQVLEVFKHHRDLPADLSMTFLKSQASGEPIPYDVGDELVVFLHWLPKSSTFFVGNHSEWVFRIQDGRIKGDAAYDFLAELRTLSARK